MTLNILFLGIMIEIVDLSDTMVFPISSKPIDESISVLYHNGRYKKQW